MTMIHQALCGYDRGHRLLAASRGADQATVDAAERYSDLTGYVPAELPDDAIDHYQVNPLGRSVAFSRTWNDPDSSRRGTVVTHSLLIPTEMWLEAEDPWSWARLHRRPVRLEGWAGYQATLDPTVEPLSWPTSLPSSELAELVDLWQRGQPIVWLSLPTLDHARAVWPLLTRAERAEFSFHGLALSSVSRRLALVPSSMAAAAMLGGGPRVVRLQPGGVGDLPDLGLVRAEAAALGIGVPLGKLRIAARALELHGRAVSGVSDVAAFTGLDALARVGTVHPEADVVRALVPVWLRYAVQPRPNMLWSVRFALECPLIRAQLERATDLAPTIRAAMAGLVERLRADRPQDLAAGMEALRRQDPHGLALLGLEP